MGDTAKQFHRRLVAPTSVSGGFNASHAELPPSFAHQLPAGRPPLTVERSPAATSVIDVLDRVLDKGIVIDAWVRVSVAGIDLITVEARVVVASFETYFKYVDALAHRTPVVTTVAAQGIQVQLSAPAMREGRRYRRARR